MPEWRHRFSFKCEQIFVDEAGWIHPKIWMNSRGPSQRDDLCYQTGAMIGLAVNCLSNRALKKDFPHLHVPEIELLRGRKTWGERVVEMRREVLAHTGEFGEQASVQERSVFVNEGGSLSRGAISLTRRGDFFYFSSFEMEMAVWLEFCALVLRDEYVALVDKRYYLPFLVTRPPTDFARGMVLPSARKPRRVTNWMPFVTEADSRPENIPLPKMSAPKKVSAVVGQYEDETALLDCAPASNETISSEAELEAVAVLPRNAGPLVAVVKSQEGKFQIVLAESHYDEEEDEQYLDFQTELERFQTFKEFLELMIHVGRSDEFLDFGPDPGPEPIWTKVGFNSWVVPINGATKPAIAKSREALKRELRKLGEPRAVSLQLGDSSLSENLSWRAPSGGLSRAELIRWVFLAHCCEQAKEFPGVYLPEASVLFSGEESTAPTRQSSIQATYNFTELPKVNGIFEQLVIAQDDVLTAIIAKYL